FTVARDLVGEARHRAHFAPPADQVNQTPEHRCALRCSRMYDANRARAEQWKWPSSSGGRSYRAWLCNVTDMTACRQNGRTSRIARPYLLHGMLRPRTIRLSGFRTCVRLKIPRP